jgi:hypothetical protein
MARFSPALTFTFLCYTLSCPVYAADPARDFSGKWFLDARASNTRTLTIPAEQALTVVQQDIAVRCSSNTADGAAAQWTYLLDGTETRVRIGDETRSSIVKWEGAALLVNTLVNTQVSASQDYTVMDRWQLSSDPAVLTVTRQVVRQGVTVEGVLVYAKAAQPAVTGSSLEPVDRAIGVAPQPALIRQPEPQDQPAAGELTVASGTRIALSLRNGLDTKHTHEGDRVYLETIEPIAVAGHIVIPRGSYVNGTVTESRPAHGVKGKGEMYIRFDSLLLPNGVSRDFHSRLVSADSSARGSVDSNEGKVTGERDGSGDARTVATGGGIGAGVGGIAGSAAGHPLGGVGIGAGAGVGVGLATILHDKRPEAVLPRGTIVEMILDRDLRFTPSELW